MKKFIIYLAVSSLIVGIFPISVIAEELEIRAEEEKVTKIYEEVTNQELSSDILHEQLSQKNEEMIISNDQAVRKEETHVEIATNEDDHNC